MFPARPSSLLISCRVLEPTKESSRLCSMLTSGSAAPVLGPPGARPSYLSPSPVAAWLGTPGPLGWGGWWVSWGWGLTVLRASLTLPWLGALPRGEEVLGSG